MTNSIGSEAASESAGTHPEIEGENMRPVTTVLIEEAHSGDWAIGGKALTTADV